MLTQSSLTQTLGPWVEPSSARPARALAREHELLGELEAGLPRASAFSQQFSPAVLNALPFHWAGYHLEVRYTYRLEGLESTDALWDGLRGNVRREIRKARTRVEVVDDLGLDRFYDVLSKTYTRQRIPTPHSLAELERLEAACARRGAGATLFARDDAGQVHAVAWAVWDRRAAYYLLAGAEPHLRNSGASSLLVWEAIMRARARDRRLRLPRLDAPAGGAVLPRFRRPSDAVPQRHPDEPGPPPGPHGPVGLAPARRATLTARPVARRHTAGHSLPRRNGSGSSHARPQTASQPRAHRSHASGGEALGVGRSQVLERIAPPDGARRLRRRRTLAPGEVGVDQGGQIDPGHRARVMPQVEPRVDLQEVQPAAVVALEIQLGDASQAEPGDHVATQRRDVRAAGRPRPRCSARSRAGTSGSCGR